MGNLRFKKLFIFVFVLLFFALVIFMIKNIFQKDRADGVVKGAITSPIQNITIIPTAFLPTATSAAPTPTATVLKKASYSIAIFGDSMVDTMGEELEYLQKILTSKYPLTEFNLYNYGIGGQNIEQGLARFESSFVNRKRQYPPLPALSPYVLIIGSFAYNPFAAHDRNKHYTLLKELIAKARIISPHVYLLAEIAPLKTGFGKGKNGVNMMEDTAYQHAVHILEQLDNVVNLSASENIPLINVYHQSRISGSFGNPYYVNPDDGIHPSITGHLFTAGIISENISLD